MEVGHGHTWKCRAICRVGYQNDIKIMLTLGVYRLPSLNLGSPCRVFEGLETWVLPAMAVGNLFVLSTFCFLGEMLYNVTAQRQSMFRIFIGGLLL